MSGRVGIEASALEPIEHEELETLLDPLLSRVGVKPRDVLSVTITPKRVTLKMKVRQERGRAIPHAWAHVQLEVLEGVADDA